MSEYASTADIVGLHSVLHRLLEPWVEPMVKSRGKGKPPTRDTVTRVERALRNIDDARGGFSPTTPGNGSPGSGKGAGGARAKIFDADGNVIDVVVLTSVEALASRPPDHAAGDLAHLCATAARCAQRCEALIDDTIGRTTAERLDLGDRPPDDRSPMAATLYARRRARALIVIDERYGQRPTRQTMGRATSAARALERVVDAWAWLPRVQTSITVEPDAMAVDLTERWCVSHLRCGARVERYRTDRCSWCYQFELAEGFAPPVALVQLHVDRRKVYEHEIVPFRKAHRDRQRQAKRTSA
jgi:hypothetical protein